MFVSTDVNWPILASAMRQWGFDSILDMIGMIGTTAHETAHYFQPIHEFGSNFSRYGYAPDGKDYGGRGYIQTTWQSNYQRVQALTGVDCANHPELLLVPEYAAQAACVYWQDRGLHAVCQARDWKELRVRVYGGVDPVGQGQIAYAESILYPLAQQRGWT